MKRLLVLAVGSHGGWIHREVPVSMAGKVVSTLHMLTRTENMGHTVFWSLQLQQQNYAHSFAFLRYASPFLKMFLYLYHHHHHHHHPSSSSSSSSRSSLRPVLFSIWPTKSLVVIYAAWGALHSFREGIYKSTAYADFCINGMEGSDDVKTTRVCSFFEERCIVGCVSTLSDIFRLFFLWSTPKRYDRNITRRSVRPTYTRNLT